MRWTETDIARHLGDKFFQLQQKSIGSFAVVDLNEPEEPEPKPLHFSRWTDQELEYLMELKRQGRTHAQCGMALNRTEYAIMDKWQSRIEWGHRVECVKVRTTLWLDDIARVVCDVYNTTKTEFVSHRRRHYIVEARQVFYWLARKHTSFSLPQIGAFCGGRDHTTVLHGVNKIDADLARYRKNIDLCVFDLGLTETQEAA